MIIEKSRFLRNLEGLGLASRFWKFGIEVFGYFIELSLKLAFTDLKEN